MSKRLYVLPLPGTGQQREETTSRQNLAALGLLDSDSGVVESISSDPRDGSVDGYYRGRYAWKLATELEELATGHDGAVPLSNPDGPAPWAGYYHVSSADVNPVEPQVADWLQQYALSLTKEGTFASHRRELATSLSQPNHPFGNGQTAYVGVPATATKVRWLNPDTKTTAEPTLVTTRSAELGDVDIFDAQAAPYSNPSLVYAIAYGDEGPTDVRVWDERGAGTKLDADNVVQWQKCFVASHDFAGEAVIDNGLVRLRFDESAPSFTVERWDSNNETWTSQALGTSDWSFWDLDVRSVGLASVHATVEFRNTTASPTDYQTLDCWVKRGWTDPLWGERGAATPSGLVDLLSPVAATTVFEPGESKGLVDRGAL